MNEPSPPPAHPRREAEEIFRFTVAESEKGLRLDAFLAARLRENGISRERVKRLVRDGKASIDNVAATSTKELLPPGSEVKILVAPPSGALSPEEGDMDILYRDPVLAVINKPAGLAVHPSPGGPDGTLVHRLLSHFPELAEREGVRPGIVHRLDKDTSGLMLVALTEQCRLALAGMFARHEIYKEYLALVHGVPAKQAETISASIGRDPARKTRMAVVAQGKPAKSARRTLFADPRGRFALEAIRIFSGRTHQVRVHMRHIGHPLLGDSLYGGGRRVDEATSAGRGTALTGPERARGRRPGTVPACPASRQMLHAWKLAFTHPLPERMAKIRPPGASGLQGTTLSFCCPPPPDFSAAVQFLARRTLRVVVTGSPGCGKSALLGFLRDAGAPTFSADAEIGRLYAPGEDGHCLLRRHFGNRFVPEENGPVDKAALVEAFAREPALRRTVEALLHPLVFHALGLFWREQERGNVPLAVAEIPLYPESGGEEREADGEAPVLVGVSCPFSLRARRLSRHRGWSAERIAGVESWQWPEEKKLRACDLVIANTGSPEHLKSAAVALLADLNRIAEEREKAAVSELERIWKNPG